MRPMRTLLGSLVLLAMLAPGALAPGMARAADDLPPLADVPLFRGDDRRSAVHPGPGPVSEPQLAWAVELDSETTSFPILVGGLLIVGTADGHLVALDARTGEERWRATGGGRFAGAPAAAAGIVVAADSTSIRAFDAATGAERWQRDVVSENARIEIVDGVAYVGTIDGAVKGLDLQTGAESWSWQGDPGLSVRVDIVADGVVYANPSDGRLLAIDIADGSERWGWQSRASLLGYVMASDTVCVNGAGQEPQRSIRRPVESGGGSFRPAGTQVVVGSRMQSSMWGRVSTGPTPSTTDGDTYTVVWHNDTPTGFTLALAGDALYGVTTDGSLFAIGADDGALIWEVPTDASGSIMGPVISGGMAFTVDQDGGRTVRAFAEPDLIARLPKPVFAQPSPPRLAGLPDPFRVVRATPLAETGVVLSAYDPRVPRARRA